MYPVIFQPIYYKYSVCNAIYNNNFTTESLNQTATIIMCSLQIVVLNHHQVCKLQLHQLPGSANCQATVIQVSSVCQVTNTAVNPSANSINLQPYIIQVYCNIHCSANHIHILQQSISLFSKIYSSAGQMCI